MKEVRESTFENNYKRISFTEKDSYYSLKKLKKRFSIICY